MRTANTHETARLFSLPTGHGRGTHRCNQHTQNVGMERQEIAPPVIRLTRLLINMRSLIAYQSLPHLNPGASAQCGGGRRAGLACTYRRAFRQAV